MTSSWILGVVLCLVFVSSNAQSCDQPLGAEDGRLKDDQFSASTEYNKWHGAKYARLNLPDDAWCSKKSDKRPHIMVSLNGTHRITAIAIQGRNHSEFAGWYVNKFEMWYQYKGFQSVLKKYLNKVFDGPTEKNEIIKVPVDVVTNKIMIKPVKWYGVFACVRLELYGCAVTPKPDFCKDAGCSHNCQNGEKSAQCYCPTGYEMGNDNKTCHDINECANVEKPVCDPFTTECHNKDGGYFCKCLDGLEKRYVGENKCHNINECADPRQNDCQQKCIDKYRTYECACNDGYVMNGDKKTCRDVDECATKTDKCDKNTTTCENSIGSYKCNCNAPGLRHKRNDKTTCEDINECLVGKGGCAHNCTNIYGSFKCSCNKGYYLHSNKVSCVDIDECATGEAKCQQECVNNNGGYSCECSKGYHMDNGTCVDTDECVTSNDCAHKCDNTVGSYKCSCKTGYRLHSDKRLCVDINECEEQTDGCDRGTSSCYNNDGSYTCRCSDGFVKDVKTGKCTAKKCPALSPPINGYLEPSECALDKSKQYRDVCNFKCNPGYELYGQSTNTTTCTKFGLWSLRGGFQPRCVPIRCPPLQMKENMQVAPQDCALKGGEYNKICQVYCVGGHQMVGVNKLLCMKDGHYDTSLNNTKCVADKKLECPKDLTITLPLGAKDMVLPLDKLSTKLDVSKLSSEPKGVLTGEYRFQSNPISQLVTLKAHAAPYNSATCEFHVQVEDREPPRVLNCPPENVYITINSRQDTITWPEPTFEDNAKVKKVTVNIPNGQARGEQVYYVFYSATDDFLNERVCRFFVHVKAKYCDNNVNNLPGADGAMNPFIFPFGPNGMKAIVNCKPTDIFPKNVTKVPGNIFECKDGAWEHIPDCVPFSDKTGSSCPSGHVVVQKQYVNTLHCAKCPKGSMELAGQCIPCSKGTYQDKYGSTNCTSCPPHTTSFLEGQKDVKSCQAMCQPGEYSMTGLYGSNGCDRCPEGSYQDLHGQKSCKVCPDGGKSPKGSRTVDDCKLPARIHRIYPENESIKAKEGDDVTIDCYSTGSPRPYVKIESTKQLPPASFRGAVSRRPLPTGNRHISGMRLQITGVTKYDSTIYKCVADNNLGVDAREVALEVQ